MANQGKREVDQLLADSFKELACQNPIEKITVKEITDRAGVIRPTFYNHFQDKYELLEWIINRDLIEPVRPFIRSGLMTQAMTFLFINIEKEKNFYLKVSRLDGQNSFYSIAQNCIQVLFEEVCGEHRKRRQPKYEWLTPKRLAQYYGQSMVFVLIEWIQSGMTISAEDLAELYQYMISHSLEDSLKDL
ncbi:MAG: TetR family transcriptional regulator [Eubacterium sp.]|nr:TetR family transcriptional regulator [Eubacterium sp.]